MKLRTGSIIRSSLFSGMVAEGHGCYDAGNIGQIYQKLRVIDIAKNGKCWTLLWLDWWTNLI